MLVVCFLCGVCLVAQSCPTLCKEYWRGLPCLSPWDLPNPGIKLRSPTMQADSLLSEPLGKHKNIGMGSLSLLQGILPAQGSNEDLLHCRQILYQLSYQGIPVCFLLLSNNIPLYVLAQMVKRLPTVWETQVWSLGRENPLEKEMATHSSTLAWKIPWTEEPCRLQSMVSQRVRHDWAASLTHSYVYISSVQSLNCV